MGLNWPWESSGVTISSPTSTSASQWKSKNQERDPSQKTTTLMRWLVDSVPGSRSQFSPPAGKSKSRCQNTTTPSSSTARLWWRKWSRGHRSIPRNWIQSRKPSKSAPHCLHLTHNRALCWPLSRWLSRVEKCLISWHSGSRTGSFWSRRDHCQIWEKGLDLCLYAMHPCSVLV